MTKDFKDQYGNTIKGLFGEIETLSNTINKHVENADKYIENTRNQIPENERPLFDEALKSQTEKMHRDVNKANNETKKAREKHNR